MVAWSEASSWLEFGEFKWPRWGERLVDRLGRFGFLCFQVLVFTARFWFGRGDGFWLIVMASGDGRRHVEVRVDGRRWLRQRCTCTVHTWI